MTKYNAKGFWHHPGQKERVPAGEGPDKQERHEWLFFNSKLEWDVYQLLLNHFPWEIIEKDYPIPLAMSTTNKYKILIEYRIDFVIRRPQKEKPFYVEAKGFLTTVARMKLQLMGINHPEIADNTHLVFRDAVKIIADCPVNYHSFKGFEEWLNLNY